MADQVLKLQELKDFFVAMTCKMLNIDPTTPEGKGKVRTTWPADGQPSWKITDDIAFLRITPIDDKQARTLNILDNPSQENNVYLDRKTGYTRVHKIDWTLYGPNSYDNADIIRNLIFDNDYMQYFKEKNLFLITDVPMPTRLPELYNGQWWERTDFSATFNESVIREKQIPFIVSGDVKILTDR